MNTVRYTVLDGEILSEKRSEVRKHYVPDPVGSTIALIDNANTTTDTLSYWPYGELQAESGSTPTPFRFIGTLGYYEDKKSNLIYDRTRYLNTRYARWMTEDFVSPYSIVYSNGDEQIDYFWERVNLYAYVMDSPVTYVDLAGAQLSLGPITGDPIGPNYTKWCGKTKRCPTDLPPDEIIKQGVNCIDIACGFHDQCMDRASPDRNAMGRCDATLCARSHKCNNGGCKGNKHETNCKYIGGQIEFLFCNFEINGPKPWIPTFPSPSTRKRRDDRRRIM